MNYVFQNKFRSLHTLIYQAHVCPHLPFLCLCHYLCLSLSTPAPRPLPMPMPLLVPMPVPMPHAHAYAHRSCPMPLPMLMISRLSPLAILSVESFAHYNSLAVIQSE